MRKNSLEYPVEFIEDAFGENERLAALLREVTGAEHPRVLLVADMNVVQRARGLGTKIGRYVKEHGIELAANPVVPTGGEHMKFGPTQLSQLVSAVLDAKLGKNDVIIALGGGALLDLAGYVAMQARGGVKLLRMPTTPLAMMDAAFADYAAIDIGKVKDSLRVPSRPAAVVIDTHFSASVMDGVWNAGFSAALRYALAKDSVLFKRLGEQVDGYCKRDAAILAEVVKLVVASRLKKGPTDFAEWETLRLEAISDYKLPHGFAVPMAVLIEMRYAVNRGVLTAEDFASVRGMIDKCLPSDALQHAQHLLLRTDALLCGLDAWRLATGGETVVTLAGFGKTDDVVPDRDLYVRTISSLMAPSNMV